MKAILAWGWLSLVACQSSRTQLDAPALAGSAHERVEALAELERLDQRKPLPLLPVMANHQKQNMREHLVAVQEIVAAAGQHDFHKIAQAAQRIGYSESMGQMCEHLGAGAPGFTERALAFHHSADRIVDAARKEDTVAVLAALADTLSTCTGCHESYKQKVVATLAE